MIWFRCILPNNWRCHAALFTRIQLQLYLKNSSRNFIKCHILLHHDINRCRLCLGTYRSTGVTAMVCFSPFSIYIYISQKLMHGISPTCIFCNNLKFKTAGYILSLVIQQKKTLLSYASKIFLVEFTINWCNLVCMVFSIFNPILVNLIHI